jgi:outer membrane protein assembly factor BamC
MIRFARIFLRLSGLFLVFGVLLGCTTRFDSLLPDRRPDYRESQVNTNRLEVPPDLTGSTIDDTLAVPELNPTGNAKFSTYSSERTSGGLVKPAAAVLPTPTDIQVEREGDRRWLLVLKQTPEQLWPKIKEFWTSNGLVLKRDDPRIGIMETGWAENRADIPAGVIRDILSKFIDFAYSAPTRDKFRVRVERVDDGTAIYLTHYGMEEVNRGEGIGKDKSSSTQWQSRPADPELEAEMLNRLMVYLGAAEKRATLQAASAATPGKPHTRLTTVDGQPALLIDDTYARAWRWVGLALDITNFVVEDQERAKGTYVVEYRKPEEGGQQPGFFSKLAFWKDGNAPTPGTRYQVRLAGQGSQTVVLVQNAAGQPDTSPAATQLLQSLKDSIK